MRLNATQGMRWYWNENGLAHYSAAKNMLPIPGEIVTCLNCSKSFISRITYHAITLFAQRMRYLNFVYRVHKLTRQSAQSASIKQNHFFVHVSKIGV